MRRFYHLDRTDIRYNRQHSDGMASLGLQQNPTEFYGANMLVFFALLVYFIHSAVHFKRKTHSKKALKIAFCTDQTFRQILQNSRALYVHIDVKLARKTIAFFTLKIV